MAKARKPVQSVGQTVASPSPRTRKKQLRNHVVFVFDDSGSMIGIAPVAKKELNKMMDKTRESAASSGQKTLVSLLYFGSRVDVKYKHQPTDALLPIEHYNPRQGSTALFSGVNKGIETLDEVVTLKTYDDSFLVITVTDGEENSSGQDVIKRTVQLMNEKQKLDTWTFVFLLPRGKADWFARNYNVPRGNIQEWDQTEQGTEVMSVSTQSGLENYYTARAKGQRSVASFFVQPDLGKVNTRQLKKLEDMTNQCVVYDVPAEARIAQFVESKTKAAYIPGIAFYQLMKTEKAVSASKKVMIRDKQTGKVYGGQEARRMIGLPDGASAKVEPGNHSKYDIFIQSKVSFGNRILPRGTKVLVLNPGVPI